MGWQEAGVILLILFAVVVTAGVVSGPRPARSAGGPRCGGCGVGLGPQRWRYGGVELCERCAINLGLPPIDPGH